MTFGLSGAALAGIAMAGATVYSANRSSNAAGNAADAQSASAQLGIDESRRQFDRVQQLLSPYVQAGQQGMAGQQNLIGLNGAPAQQQAINGIQSSPMFGAMAKQGEDAILQNASATGGLRGGNTQAALGQFRPQLLSQLIDQQYARLGGMTQIGQASAAGVGAAGMQTGQNVAGLFGQQGAAQAGAALASGQATGQMVNGAAGALGIYRGLGGNMFGGSSWMPAASNIMPRPSYGEAPPQVGAWAPEPSQF